MEAVKRRLIRSVTQKHVHNNVTQLVTETIPLLTALRTPEPLIEMHAMVLGAEQVT